MREMTLKDIQQVSLEILDVIDMFCSNNGINYSLGYGSLIGAIRHHGCIPWDDDIDIIMTRPDYDKFVKLSACFPDGYKLFAPELGNCFHAISRVCELKRTRVHRYYNWTKEDVGVWIDVFPYDGMPQDGGKALRNQADKCYITCLAHAGVSTKFVLKQNYTNLKRWVRRGYLSPKKEIRHYLEIRDKVNYDDSEKVRNYASPYNLKDIHAKSLFSGYTRVPFENSAIPVIDGYDTYLTQIYGNYLLLPPPNLQVRGHALNRFFWIK